MLSLPPQVHERQAARMRTRSEWFLTPVVASDSDPSAIHILRGSNRSSSGNIGKQPHDLRVSFDQKEEDLYEFDIFAL